MLRSAFWFITVLAMVSRVPALAAAARSADLRPNILLILADDLGVEGLGSYGGLDYRTPQLDRLAATGVRFTHAYAQPLCTPTRLQLMTGKYNHRNWLAFGIMDPKEQSAITCVAPATGPASPASGSFTGLTGQGGGPKPS